MLLERVYEEDAAWQMGRSDPISIASAIANTRIAVHVGDMATRHSPEKRPVAAMDPMELRTGKPLRKKGV